MRYGQGPDNFFTNHQLMEWKSIFQRNSITKTSNGDDCWGIDKKCFAYGWYKKKVMPLFSEHFDKALKLIFASFIDCDRTFPVHKDIKPLPEGETGKHAVSILVPFTLDNSFDKFGEVSTDIYDEDHNKIDELAWRRNSFVWWESDLNHASSDYKALGIQTKQYFITHTYV